MVLFKLCSHPVIFSLIILLTLSTPIMSSKGIFEIHIKKYFLYPSLNLTKCCTKPEMSPSDCASQCKIFMEICLSIYQRVPHRYACDIGENMIVTDVLGNEQLSTHGNRDYFIKVHERWMKNFNILVRIKHRDEKTKKDSLIVTLSSAEENVKPSSDWITKQLSNPKDLFELLVSFRYSCSKYYYDEKCDKYCKPSQSDSGHYNCSSNGDIICHDGYSGNYCDKVVCQNKCVHGTCIGPNLCRCSTGWAGDSCDQCIRYPGCVNGGCRKDEKTNDLLPLTCDCKKGWGGMFCNIDLKFCSNNPNVCHNGGECQNFGDINTNQQYRCICKPGFRGTHCEKSVENCVIRGCLNDGFCNINGEKNISKCICKGSFYGDRCQFNMTSCSEAPCIGSNSKCYPDPKLGFRCDCATGFIGRNCEIDKDECSTNPCSNGGMCIDRASGFRCVCPVGFSGNRCQVNNNDCQRLSCMNGAKCMDKANRIDCECTPGWTGDMCNKNINECAINSPCLNDGICEDTPGAYKCVCPWPWVGKHCTVKDGRNSTNIKDKQCFINPCQNDGVCFLFSRADDHLIKDTLKSIGGPYYCICQPGFTGPLCKQVIVANDTSFNDNYNSMSTPFVGFRQKNEKNAMTLINLIIISIGIPSILIILVVITLIWCKTSKKLKKLNLASKYENNLIKTHNFANNADIKILNNQLHHGHGRVSGRDTVSQSLKLNNELSKNEINNCSNNISMPHLPHCTYKCSMVALNPCNLPYGSSASTNSKFISMKTVDINEEEDCFIEKSYSSVNDREAEPESIYLNSLSPYKELKKNNLKSSLDSNINNLMEQRSGTSPNTCKVKQKRSNQMGHGMCSSENSLLETPVDHNLRDIPEG